MEATTQIAEQELLDAARSGDSRALDSLLERLQGRVLRFTHRLCGDPDSAEDAAQETLIAAARTLGQFRGDASISTWLYTIARSFCIKRKRRSKFAPASEASLDAPDSGESRRLTDPSRSPDELVADLELRQALERALATLPTGQREVLVLRDVEGLSAREVAQVTGLSEKAVKSRLHRARLAVREVLAPEFGRARAVAAGGCPDVARLFSKKLEGEIGPDLCARLEEHLAQCPRCEATCTSLRRLIDVCRSTPEPEVPGRVRAAIAKRTNADRGN